MICAHTGDAGKQLVTRLTEFANLCLAGRVQFSVLHLICGANLCVLTKKDGGGHVQPIAVGCTLRRMVAKSAVRRVQYKVANLLTRV
jgi:hypothetical protein